MAKSSHNNTVLYITGANLLLPYDDQRTGRSSPLKFLLFRCPGDNTPEGQIYRMRRDAIKLRKDGAAILGVFDELLLAYLGNKIAALRGFVVNHDLARASFAQISITIGIRPVRTVMTAVRELVRVGLLMEVDRPDFEAAIKHDRTIEVTPRAPCPTRERKRHGDLNDPSDGRANDAPSGHQATPATPARDEAAAQGQSIGDLAPRRPRSRCLPRDQMAASGPFRNVPEKGGGTLDARLDTPNRQTPEAAAAAATPPCLPLPAHGSGCAEADNQTAPAAPSRTTDAQTADHPTADGHTYTLGIQPQDDGPVTITETQTSDGGTVVEIAAPCHAVPATQAHQPAANDPNPPDPTEADPGQGQAASRRTPPMSWHAEAWGQQVFEVMHPTHEDVVAQGRLRIKDGAPAPQGPEEFRRCEIASYASTLTRALNWMSQPQALKLQQEALKLASQTLRKKPRGTRGRLWGGMMRLYVRSIKATGGNASGPP